MKSTAKIYLPVLASALLIGMSASAFAERNHSGSTTPAVVVTHLGTTLIGAAGYTGTGNFAYADSTNGGRLSASIHLPIDGSIIQDSNAAISDAANNLVTLTILNGTSTVATYNLAISDIDFAYSNATTVSGETAEFVVAASESAATVYSVTSGSDATGTALPVLAAGETVNISVNGVSVLSGALAASVGHH